MLAAVTTSFGAYPHKDCMNEVHLLPNASASTALGYVALTVDV
jgi:hypothetical protein